MFHPPVFPSFQKGIHFETCTARRVHFHLRFNSNFFFTFLAFPDHRIWRIVKSSLSWVIHCAVNCPFVHVEWNVSSESGTCELFLSWSIVIMSLIIVAFYVFCCYMSMNLKCSSHFPLILRTCSWSPSILAWSLVVLEQRKVYSEMQAAPNSADSVLHESNFFFFASDSLLYRRYWVSSTAIIYMYRKDVVLGWINQSTVVPAQFETLVFLCSWFLSMVLFFLILHIFWHYGVTLLLISARIV